MKILIIDDSRVMRQIIARTLRQAGLEGHETVEAANGTEGLEALEKHAPDLVLSDWNMPGMTGLELLQEIRGRGHTVPFGFVTYDGSPQMRSRAEGSGALFVITKPFTAEAFREALAPTLGAA